MRYAAFHHLLLATQKEAPMHRVLTVLLALGIVFSLASPVYAHHPGDRCRDFQQEAEEMEPEPINWAGAYTVVLYDFEPMNWQGWTRIDNTAELDEFWHIDDFAPPVGPGICGIYFYHMETKSFSGTRKMILLK
jgi:hypothetical protein